MRRKYRITKHERFYNYTVECRSWWWPFWRIVAFRGSVEEAEEAARAHAKAVIKDLGWLP